MDHNIWGAITGFRGHGIQYQHESHHIAADRPVSFLFFFFFFFFCCPLPRRFDFKLSFPSLLLPGRRNMICHQTDRLSVVAYVPTFDLYSYCILYMRERREGCRISYLLVTTTLSNRGRASPSTSIHIIRTDRDGVNCYLTKLYIRLQC